MEYLTTIAALEEAYGTPGEAANLKVADRVTPLYRKWVEAARFCILSTIGPEGTDGSPRGDDGPVVQIADDETLLMPDWHGNNRIDSLRNIIRDPRVSLMFMVPGAANVVRVNGSARLTLNTTLRARFEHNAKMPRAVIVVQVDEIYTQCARAILRADLWRRDDSVGLPTVGDILREQSGETFDGESYDTSWASRAADTMW